MAPAGSPPLAAAAAAAAAAESLEKLTCQTQESFSRPQCPQMSLRDCEGKKEAASQRHSSCWATAITPGVKGQDQPSLSPDETLSPRGDTADLLLFFTAVDLQSCNDTLSPAADPPSRLCDQTAQTHGGSGGGESRTHEVAPIFFHTLLEMPEESRARD